MEQYKKIDIKKIFSSEIGLVLVLILLGLIFSFTSPSFFTTANLLNISRQVSIVLIISIGMLCVILCSEIDLSVGAIVALSGVGCAIILRSTGSVVLAIVLPLVIGSVLGVINAIFIVHFYIPSFIVTLAMMMIIRGIALVWTNGRAIAGLPRNFAVLGAGYIGIIPVSTILCVILLFFAYLVLQKTRHGVYMKAIGANLEAANLSAIPIKTYKTAAFLVSGLMSGIGGIITTSRLLSAQAIAAEGMEMDVLSAVILGGASLSGGKGTITGTILGALIIGVINNGMNQLGLSAFYQQIVKGSIIIAAVFVRRRKHN